MIDGYYLLTRRLLEAAITLARIDHRNTTRYWNAPDFAGLSCLCADFTAHDFAPHSHEALVVAVTEAGGSEIKSRGETNEASSSALFVFNPAEPHSGRMATSKRWRYRGLYLAQPALKKLGATLGIDALPYFMKNVIRDRSLIGSFLDLHISLQNKTDSLLSEKVLSQVSASCFADMAAGANAFLQRDATAVRFRLFRR